MATGREYIELLDKMVEIEQALLPKYQTWDWRHGILNFTKR